MPDAFGTEDPYMQIVLRLLMRCTLHDKMTNDDQVLAHIDGLFRAVDSPGMKWFPTWKKVMKYYYGYKLYRALDNILKEHRYEQAGGDKDAIQVLLDKGDSIEGIISVRV